MRAGQLKQVSVEALLGEGRKHSYTRHLCRASAGHDRKLAHTAATLDIEEGEFYDPS